jgi:ubiquinone/menaquinone biosynthesis C-methylase UbiE
VTNFDDVEGRYEQLIEHSIRCGGQEHEFYVRAKARWLLDLARRRIGAPEGLDVLDVGCGIGSTDRHLGRFGRLAGVDVSEGMVRAARRANPSVEYRVCQADRLPHPDASFDLAFAICVLHHVDPGDRLTFVREMARVTRGGGLVVVIEHNPFNPLTRFVVGRCAFDEGTVLLPARETRRHLRGARLALAEERYGLFVPWNGRVATRLENALRHVPLGAQYYVAGRA